MNEINEYNSKNYERLLKECQQVKTLNYELLKILDNSYDGIYVTNGNALTTMVSKSYEKISGLKKEDLIGKYMQELVDHGIISQSASLIALETGKSVTLEQTFVTGKKAFVSASPIFDTNGNIINVVTNVREVTELYELKNQLAIKEELTNKYFSEIEAIKAKLIESSDIIAEDNNMLELLRLVKRLAVVETTILLLGETGVGKEELAKYIHKNSRRANGHFIKVNCGAIPENLIESELFGYERGSFTGANRQGKMGLFEVADKGTIFLDEIGDLPFDMQVKLLRVLQEREFIRVGGVKPINLDIRVLAATNKNLKEMVDRKVFREDLYYRINVVPITIPPLRKRKNDIIPLVNLFLKELNRKYDMNKKFSDLSLKLLLEYNWPGNVRELKNVVERVVIMTQHDTIYPNDLYFNISNSGEHLEIEAFEKFNLKEKIEKLEMEYIANYYQKYRNVRKAAEALEMDPSTYVRKRDKYKKKYNK